MTISLTHFLFLLVSAALMSGFLTARIFPLADWWSPLVGLAAVYLALILSGII